MSVEGEAAVLPSAAPLRAGDGRSMIGHAIVVRGSDRDGIDAIAVWHVATDGLRTGAWVVPSEKAFGDAATAESLLAVLTRRAILAWETDPIAHVKRIEAAAGAQPRPWSQDAIVLPDMLTEIADARARLVAAVDEHRKTNKRIAPVTWKTHVPQPAPTTAAELRSLAHIHAPSVPSPVAGTALELAALTGWAIARWQETLGVAARRKYLHGVLGPATALPPAWETRLANTFTR